MQIKTKELEEFVRLTKDARYHCLNKDKFKRLGRKILKALAEKLSLQEGEFEIRFNPGGDACSGDHILHADHLYVALHDNTGSGWFYFRTCKSRKDYSGGVNQIIYWNDFIHTGLDDLAFRIKSRCPRHPVAAIPLHSIV